MKRDILLTAIKNPPTSTETTARIPGLVRRILAQLIDFALYLALIVLTVIAKAYLLPSEAHSPYDNVIGVTIFFGLLLAPFHLTGWFTSRKGATPGKLLLRMKVVDIQSNDRCGYAQAIIREMVGKWLIGFGIGSLLVALLRQDRRGLHDLLARTKISY